MVLKSLHLDLIVTIYNFKVFGFLVSKAVGSTAGILPKVECSACEGFEQRQILRHVSAEPWVHWNYYSFKVPVGKMRCIVMVFGRINILVRGQRWKSRENTAALSDWVMLVSVDFGKTLCVWLNILKFWQKKEMAEAFAEVQGKI